MVVPLSLPFTPLKSHPCFDMFIPICKGVLDGVHNGQLLNIGPIYRFQAGDTLMSVAGRFRTTIRSLLDLNPDVLDPDSVQPGQELCFVPCIH